MIQPPPARRIGGTPYFTDRNTPSRLTAVWRRQSANDISTALHEDSNAGVGYHHVQAPEAPLGDLNHTRLGFFEADVLMEKPGPPRRRPPCLQCKECPVYD